MSADVPQSLDDIYAEFDAIFDKKSRGSKKKSKKVEFTKTETEPQREMQFAQPTEPEVASNGGIICYGDSYRDALNGMIGAETIFLDLETGSYDSKKDSLNPWQNCWPIGVAICVNECGPAYYIPVTKYNEQEVYDLLFKIFTNENCKKWINHNIKYDAHVLYNSAGINVSAMDNLQIIDTLTLAKLIDSERFRYGLDALSKDWLDEDISGYERPFKPYKHRNKDYSVIPVDIIGPYACQDVLTNRKLYKYICDNLPEDCNYVRDIEIELTKILIEIERNGLRINPEQLEATEIVNTAKLIEIEQKLEKITGRSFRPHTNADCFDILCNFYGLPVLKWTNQEDDSFSLPDDEDTEEEKDKTSNASFDKHAMVAYLSHPTVLADKRIRIVVKLIAKYRKINTFNNLFVKKYRELAVGELLHPFYNQCVRSGRMSCKKPNSQQLNAKAKSLVKPYEGEIFVSYDFSQIEYRTIAHYIESPILLEEYNNNPDADFHEFVAKLVREETGLDGMTRSGGKTLNFGLGFNMGRAKLLKSLMGNLDLMGNLVKELDELIAGGLLTKEDFDACFNREAEKRAEKVYDAYHKTFPEMKRTSRKAQAVCEQRGYIRNLYYRRRHLEKRFAYKAFNTINQSSAADLMKVAMVRIGKILRDCGHVIKIVADVHDEILFSMPKYLAEDLRILHTIAWMLENPVFPNDEKLLVPIRVAMGIGENWKKASKSAKVQNYDKFVSVDEFKRILKG